MKTRSESLVWVTLRQSESNALQFLLFFSFLCRKTILVWNRSFLLVFVRRLSDCFHPSLLPTFSSLWLAVPSEERLCCTGVWALPPVVHITPESPWTHFEFCKKTVKMCPNGWKLIVVFVKQQLIQSILLISKVNDKWQTESWCLPLLLRPLYYGGITQDYSAYTPTSPHKQMPKSLPYTEAEVQSQKSIWSKSCSDFSSLILP